MTPAPSNLQQQSRHARAAAAAMGPRCSQLAAAALLLLLCSISPAARCGAAQRPGLGGGGATLALEAAAAGSVDFEAVLLRLLPALKGTGPTSATAAAQDPAAAAAEADDAAAALPSLVEASRLVLKAPRLLNESFSEVAELASPLFWDVVAKAHELASPARAPPDADAAAAGAGSAFLRLAGELTELVARLPNSVGWPVARRVVLAAIVQHRIHQAAPFNKPEQAALARLSLRLFQVHRAAAARKGVIEFFHISKAGGTSFCHLARANGCSTQSFGARRNCLIREFDDQPRWVNNSLHVQLAPAGHRTPWFANWGARGRNPVSCATRKRFLLRRGFNVYANEYTLQLVRAGGPSSPRAVQLCSMHVNVLQLRHPHTRLPSHLKWIWALYSFHFHDNMTAFFPSHDAEHWRRLAPAATSNYYVRSLLGEAVYYLPAADLGTPHLALARLVLTQFDVLLVLERGGEANDVLLEMGLGWRHGLSEMHSRTSADVKDAAAAGLPPDLPELLSANDLDLQLYKYGSVLALLDAVVFNVAKAAGVTAGGGGGGGEDRGSASGAAAARGSGQRRRLEAAARGAGANADTGPAAAADSSEIACGYVSWHDDDWPGGG